MTFSIRGWQLHPELTAIGLAAVPEEVSYQLVCQTGHQRMTRRTKVEA